MLGADSAGAPGVRGSLLTGAGELLARHALLLIVSLGALLRFGTLGTQDFWLDEEVTLRVIEQSPLDLLKSVQLGESNPALYYLLAGGWERVFGGGEFGVRSLSALVGTATIPVVYAAAKALASRRAGLIAAALTAASPMLVWYSQEVRNYSLLVFLAALSFLCFVRALDERGHRWLWAWALTSALALSTHYFAFMLLVPQLAWLLVRRPGSRIDTGLAAGAIGVVGIALLPLVATQRGRGSWIADYALSDRVLQVPEHFLVGLQVPWEPLPALAVAVAGLVALYVAVTAEPRTLRALAIPASIFLSGLGLLLVAVLAGEDYILSRNLLELWAPFVVMLAVIFAATRVEWVGTAVTVGLCCAGVGLVIWTVATPAAQRPNYSDLAAELGETAEPRLIVSQTSFSSPLVEYLPGTSRASDTELSASELVVVEPRPSDDHAVGTCWWIHTCGGRDLSPPPPFEVPDGFTLARSGSTEAFDYSVYEAPRPIAIERPVEYFTPRVFVQAPL